MENSAFSFLGRQEKILLIVCIGHLLGLCHTMEWTEFFLKNKGNSIFNYSTNQYDHLSDMPVKDSFQRFLQIKDSYLKSDQK